MNAIDLTTLVNVKGWAGIAVTQTDQDQNIEDTITAFSAEVLRLTARGPLDGTIPTTSPFKTPVNYDDVYDGSGSERQQLRNWPATSVTSVTIGLQAIPQSTSQAVWGWVLDSDKKFVSLRGGFAATVATFQNYFNRRGYSPGPGFQDGIQNVEIVYQAGFSGVPYDLEMAVRKTVALRYKSKGWIGQRQQMMAQGGGTTTYNGWSMYPEDLKTILFYKAYVS